MDVEIFYCPTLSGYDSRAASLAVAVREAGHDARATPREHSQYDVLANGAVIFSKAGAGRFSEHDEILAALGT